MQHMYQKKANTSPPRWADRLLEWFVAPHLLEDLQGDLYEVYQKRTQAVGPTRARREYGWAVLHYLTPFFHKRKPTVGVPSVAQPHHRRFGEYPQPSLLNPDMIRNYLIVAWRNLIRNKAFSSINILGLALGMACSLFILLWVQDERSVDGFHTNGQHLYQVYERQFYDGKVEANYFTQGMLADELKRLIPNIQYASSMEWPTATTVEAGDKITKMTGTYAGADFFTMFSYPLLQGTTKTALNTPNGISISRRMAEHFFSSPEQAIGQTIRFDNKDNLSVTAVFENVPTNSSQQFDYLRPWIDFVKENKWTQNWGSTDPVTFVQLRADRDGRPADPAKVEAKIKDFVHQYRPKASGFMVELGLQPYTEKYLHANFKNGQVDGGRIEYVRLLSIVAVFILLIACINFMNLATARSTKRAKEVGVRKVVGAVRWALMGQFVGEAMLLTFVAMLVALMLVILLLPAFNQLTGKLVSLPIERPLFWVVLLGFLLTTGLVAGSYPAFILSSLKPVRVLKGSLKFGVGATFFRQGLVVFQFSLSILLIVGTMIIYRQMEFVQTRNLGYDRENLLYIPIEGDFLNKYELFKEEAGKMPGIRSVSRMEEAPTGIGHHVDDIRWVGKDPAARVSFANTVVGYDFVKTLNLKLQQGRDFSKDFSTDSASYIINETALRTIGYQGRSRPDGPAGSPIGQSLEWGMHKGQIIGVLKDFHFTSMHQAIEPLIIRLSEKPRWGTILVRLEAGKTQQALANLEKLSQKLNPKIPFTYQFSDQEYGKLYRSEQIVNQLINYFAFLAIFISCLGLFGLATFTAEQRTKEIGVRKVLGASVPGIVALLSKDFLKLVLIAIFVASPIAYYTMHHWLTDFVYRIDIEWWVFALAGLLALSIALLTVSYQSIKAALLNPVKSLRAE